MIAQTFALADAPRRTWDVLVVGAGPAGSSAARGLARRGLSVLFVDQAAFPRWKVCGCCLNGGALSSLAEAGLRDLPASLGAVPLSHFELCSAGRAARLPLRAGAALSRTALDTALVEAAIAAGAEFLPLVRASLVGTSAGERIARLRGGGGQVDVAARLILVATGLGASLAPAAPTPRRRRDRHSRVGAGLLLDRGPPWLRRGTVYMACGAAGYVGMVRLEDDRVEAAAALDPGFVRSRRGLGPAAAEIAAQSGLPMWPELATGQWRGTPALTRQAADVADARLLVLGDAAGYVEPFTGEGISWALAAAAAVAPLAERAARHWEPGIAREWRTAYRRTILRRQRLCRTLASVVRRPVLTNVLIGALTRAPGLAEPFVRRVHYSSIVPSGIGP